jgi:ArsR family transcriptional regulator
MDSAELLDLLGNKNRRRILRLLAHKPCYVTEISEYIGVSPKAVIGHLEKLDEAGLVQSRTDDSRRKYFSIARNLRLEVQVSPHEFGAKSAYPASPGFDVSSCRYVSIEASDADTRRTETRDTDSVTPELKDLATELKRLEQLENELSLAQRWVQGRLSEVWDDIDETVSDDVEDGRLHAALIGAIANGERTVPEISREVDAPPQFVEEGLEWLAEQGVAERHSGEWHLPE